MGTIYILELWLSGVHGSKLLCQIFAFTEEKELEKYKMLNPNIGYNEFYNTQELKLIRKYEKQ